MKTKNNETSIHIPDFSDLHILVLGDVMIDRYVSGLVKRISPEAPVPVVEMTGSDNRLGGAANVALNLHSLGAKVTVLSIVGNDADGETLSLMLDMITNLDNKVIKLPTRRTTVKTRIMSGNQHLLRIDKEDIFEISETESALIISTLERVIKDSTVNGIILQDYNKGLLSESLITQTIQLANQHNIATFVDPKERNFYSYKSCTVFKPNQKEAEKATGMSDYIKIDLFLKEKLKHKLTLITLGSKGMYISDATVGKHYPTQARVIADVCGAGDSVISVVCLCYLKNMTTAEIALIANSAGGQVCEQPGVVAVNLHKLKTEISDFTFTE